MTYFELVDAVRAAYAKADAGSIKEHIAFQFNIEGEAEGIFYLEIKDGAIHVEPYDYRDRDVLFFTTADTLLKISKGELEPMEAYNTQKLRAEGNLEKALILKEISVKNETAAVPEVKAEEKVEETTEKTAEAPAESVTAQTEEKAAEPEEKAVEEAAAGAVEPEEKAAEEAAAGASMTAGKKRMGRKAKKRRR